LLVIVKADLSRFLEKTSRPTTRPSFAMIEADAAPCCVYTFAELRSLLERHRQAPLSVAELLRIHQAKRTFDGNIAE
jgi:hypothetical protein